MQLTVKNLGAFEYIYIYSDTIRSLLTYSVTYKVSLPTTRLTSQQYTSVFTFKAAQIPVAPQCQPGECLRHLRLMCSILATISDWSTVNNEGMIIKKSWADVLRSQFILSGQRDTNMYVCSMIGVNTNFKACTFSW